MDASGDGCCHLTTGEKPAPVDLSHHFSAVTKRRLPSKIKQAYKFFQIPGILNVAGGLPNVAFFPFDTLEAQAAKPERWTPSPEHPAGVAEVAAPSPSPERSSDPAAASHHISVPKTLDERDPLKKVDLATALQYGQAQGYPPLLEWVRRFTREHLHPDAPYRGGPEVVLTCGATDGFAKTLNLFVDQWTEGVNHVRDRPGLLCESFVYSNILTQAQPLGMQVVPVKADAGGMAVKGPGGLEDVLANWDPSKGKRPHLMYTVTLGHNPTGIVLSVERKKEIYAVCSKYDVIIVEDEPYWYLQFPSAAVEEAKSRGRPLPPVPAPHKPARSSGYPFLDSLTPSFLSLDTEGRVVRLDTFSKTVAPGCRLGWITAQPVVAERFQRVSEATTQQPSGFVQALISELIFAGGKPTSTPTTALSAWSSVLRGSQHSPAAGSGSGSTNASPWDMSGWVRWLAGLRGVYERRMVRMCRALDEGAYLLTTTPTPPLYSSSFSCFSSSCSSSSSSTRPPSSSVSPSDETDGNEDEWSPQTVTKTRLYTYTWPRGGMFIWLRMHLESHPLWGAPRAPSAPPHSHSPPLPLEGKEGVGVLDGPLLSAALMVWLTTKPFRVLVATGSIFSATDEIRARDGWAYYRLCFAAEEEGNVDRAAARFVEGVRRFWEVRDPAVVERLLGELEPSSAGMGVGAGIGEGVGGGSTSGVERLGMSLPGKEEEEGVEELSRLGWWHMGC